MRTFKDNAGRSWSVSVNVDTARRLRSMANVDLMELVEAPEREDASGGRTDSDGLPLRAAPVRKPLLERLIRDPILLCDVLYVVCKEEADKLNVSDADFGRALYGTAIAAARSALLEEIADFFPDEGLAIRRQAEKLQAAYKLLIEKVDLKIQGYDENQLVEAALAKMAAEERGLLPEKPGTSSMSSPASAESTPAS